MCWHTILRLTVKSLASCFAAKPQKHSENDVDFIDCCRIGMRHSAVLCLCAVQKDLLTERTGQGIERENRNSEPLSRILPCLSERCSVGNGRQIRIRGYLYDKASRLIPFMAPGMSVSVYVSNIVEEHLKRHGELLKDELERFLYKDSLWKN